MEYRFVRTPTDEERQELEQMKQQEVGRVAMRAHMILLSTDGYTVPEIEEIHNMTNVTIYKWFNRFDEEGPSGLFDRQREGRPPDVDETVKAEVEEAVSEPPTELGYNFTRWTVPTLREHVAQTMDKVFSGETIRTLLHKLGFRWRRPRWANMRQDPEAPERMAAIQHAILRADDGTVLLVEDETICKTLPPLRAMWMREGQQVRVPTPFSNDDFALYGTLNLETGEMVTGYFEKAVSDHTIAHLAQILEHYPERDIILVWDQAPFHTSQQVEAWIDQHDRLTVLWLPKYAPQENALEDLWRHLKDRVAANLTRTLKALKAACRTFFRQHEQAELLQLAGLPA